MADTPIFQDMQEGCFDSVLDLFGQDATWEKDGGDVTGLVLFNDPTKEERINVVAGRGLNHVGYNNADIKKPYIEYREKQFEGLYELVYSKDVNQYIEVNGTRYYGAKTLAFFDGQTYRVYLEKATEEEILPE